MTTRSATPAWFWPTITGGLLIALSWFFDPAGVPEVVGELLFLVGASSFMVVAFRTARREEIGFARAIARTARDGLRFLWEFLP